jgi:hypothetical protein
MLASYNPEPHWKWLIQYIARASLSPPTLSAVHSPHKTVATTPHHSLGSCQAKFDKGLATKHHSHLPLAVVYTALQADTLPSHFTCRTSPAENYNLETVNKEGRAGTHSFSLGTIEREESITQEPRLSPLHRGRTFHFHYILAPAEITKDGPVRWRCRMCRRIRTR